jgi:hypothetical protein
MLGTCGHLGETVLSRVIVSTITRIGQCANIRLGGKPSYMPDGPMTDQIVHDRARRMLAAALS